MNHPCLQRKAYVDRITDKQRWFSKADGLLHAAHFLEAEVQRFYEQLQHPPDEAGKQVIMDPELDRLVEVYFMLVGCGFENLLKGIHIARRKTPVSEPELPREINTHNLLRIAQYLQLDLDKREEDLLARLEIVVVWRGRYPVPTEYGRIEPFHKKPDDLKVANRLRGKLQQLQS